MTVMPLHAFCYSSQVVQKLVIDRLLPGLATINPYINIRLKTYSIPN